MPKLGSFATGWFESAPNPNGTVKQVLGLAWLTALRGERSTVPSVCAQTLSCPLTFMEWPLWRDTPPSTAG